MAKKVIQVPIDDDLLRDLSRVAGERRQSRSELIRLACRDYLRAREREDLDRIYEEGYRRIPETSEWAESQEEEMSAMLEEERW